MSRIIMTTTKPKYGFKITNYYTDKTTSSTEFYENDEVENLSYVEKGEVKSVTGRIDKIDIGFNKASRTYDVVNDAKVYNINVDASESKKSNIVSIKAKEVLEYLPESGKEIEKVKVEPILTVWLKSTLSDGTSSEMDITKGMKLFNVTIQKKGESVTSDFTVKSFLYTVRHSQQEPTIVGLVLENETVEPVIFEDIKVCGEKGIVVEQGANLSDLVASSTSTSVGMILPESKFNDVLTVGKSLTILGAKELVSAASGSRATDEILANETILLNTMNCSKDVDIVVKGVTFTTNAYINPNGCSSLTMKNCRFIETTPNASKSYMLKDSTFRAAEDKPLLLQIEGCYFGTNTASGANKMYNLVELSARIADGSYVKNCYFAKGCTTHNILNFYDIEDGATLDISNNHFELSKNAVRIGFKGNPNCTVNINNNTYDETDPDLAWGGIVMVQPYNADTLSFAGVTLNIFNNKYTKGECQVGYMYAVGVPSITKEKGPIVNTDGEFNYILN